jgi:hypothetical protein
MPDWNNNDAARADDNNNSSLEFSHVAGILRILGKRWMLLNFEKHEQQQRSNALWRTKADFDRHQRHHAGRKAP